MHDVDAKNGRAGMTRSPRLTSLLLLVAACTAALAIALVRSVAAPAEPGSGKDGTGQRSEDRSGSSGRSERSGGGGEGRRGGGRPDRYTIPGDAVFPEGIAREPGSKRFFVSSTTDGTIFRGHLSEPAIVAANKGRLPIVVQSNTGRLFRIDTRTRRVSRIALRGGARVPNGDGLVLAGNTLYVVRNAQEQIVQITLSSTRRSGRIRRRFTSRRLGFPTTAVRDGRRLLVVNSQFDRRDATPSLPFTVAALRRP